ncbi:lytic transglycosylase domain-containing protein [Pseudoxanthomonas sp. PXM02]|uniref:lytic transglycosylase domain-containing protein n=1 Tax=Pseudoxanthomonas sp. PXM02 TaxID=2769294 RepID=UPI001781B38B|nr:lytic transglycosylase domain-containing protein [Pseudoxanthomonas sp. PXM02]MBD9477951.1 transglycosylase SLT domain-containing protein [Pseudoxanthomonas sp. PXM02]
MIRRNPLHMALLVAGLVFAPHAALAADPPAEQQPAPSAPPLDPASLPTSHQRSGLDIYQRFRDGLADPECDSEATNGRWKKHFSHAPGQLARAEDDVLPLFGYVVDALREAHLPTEFALIPFVESGYKPGARNPQGPAGLWQFIGITARNHGVPMREGYDGRLSPVDSTQAAVRYLKTLHGMFGGDWRLAVMAYNAGEYRLLQSMRRAGMNARNARPAELPGLSGITYAYVEKLHALACIFQQADDRDAWLKQMDRPVPRLAAHTLPGDATLEAWARQQQQPVALLKRLNPALVGRFSQGSRPIRLLAPTSEGADDVIAPTSVSAASTSTAPTAAADTSSARTHTVKRGESAWTIARRYDTTSTRLLQINGLKADAVLRPGMVLKLDDDTD